MIHRKLRALAGFLALFGAIAAPATAETWHRADTHHFVIYSDGGAGELDDFAHEAEKFDALLRLVFGIRPKEKPTKLTIYMIGDAGDVQRITGRENIAGYYFPQTEGSFAVSNRRRTRDKDRLSGKRTLFHEYAHHFMFNNFSVPAPAWFVEGFAEFVATAEFKKDGTWYFGKPAFHRAAEIEYAPRIPLDMLLTVDPDRIEGNGVDAFYGWSWALTHMLYLDSGQVGKQIDRYLKRINRGESSLEAARAEFGDLDQLERDLRDYVNGRMTFKKSETAIPYRDNVRVKRLSEADSTIVALTMRRLTGHELEQTRDGLARAAPLGGAEGWYQLGRAEYTLAERPVEGAAEDAAKPDPDYAAAEAAFDKALAIDPGHVHANVFKTRILLDRLERRPSNDASWAAARALLERANRAAPFDPLPLYALANSYLRQGERNDEISPALAAAFELAPESRELRFAHAMNLAGNGGYAQAIQLLEVVANDPHGGEGGKAAIRRIESMRDGVNHLPLPEVPDRVEGEESDKE